MSLFLKAPTSVFNILDHLARTTKSFDLFLCRSTESVSLNVEFLCEFTVSKNLDTILRILNDT